MEKGIYEAFSIEGGRTHFYQWDLSQKIIVNDPAINEVHFCNGTRDCSLVTVVKDGKADVPNLLLQTSGKVKVYGYSVNHTVVEYVYRVIERTKPEDYVYEETEVLRYAELDKRIKKLEDMGGGTGAPGEDGATFTPSVDEDGNLTWENNKGLENPSPVNIKGEKGDKGEPGYTPVRGVDYWKNEDKTEIVDEFVKKFHINAESPDEIYILDSSDIDETLSVKGKVADAAAVGNALERISSGMRMLPDYWITELHDGAKAINTAMMEAGYNKSAFLYYTDAHWTYNNRMSPMLLEYLYSHTGMTKTIFGGDIVDAESGDYDIMSYLWEWRYMLKSLPNHHSVVGNHDDGNATDNLFSENYIYGYLLAAEETPDIVRGESGLYYLIDNQAEKTRYLYLDTAFQSVVNDSNQQDFVKNALLTTPDGWHIIAVAHIWHDTDYTVTPAILAGLSVNGEYLLNLFDAYNSRQGDFINCGGLVEFCIGGHTHWDYDSVSTTGIPVILTETDSKHVRSGLNCVTGTTSENSINGIIADYDAGKITIVRVGRGESRVVTISHRNTSGYTNVLDTVGWTENMRISASGGYDEREAEYCMLTGYIYVKPGDIIRLKNVVAPDQDAGYQNTVYTFDENKVGLNSAVLYSQDTTKSAFHIVYNNGNLVQFTVPQSALNNYNSGYIRINAKTFDGTSVITVNEEIT